MPQGLVLGPLLFLININNLPNVSKYLSFFLFADDTNIYFKHHNLIQLQKIINRELKKVRKWLDGNRLSLDIDKTNFVVFHTPQIKLVKPVIIRLGKKKLKRKSCVKFLGIMLDANLSWKYHIAELSKKLSRSIGIFYKVRHLVPLEILKTLYYLLFYSFVSYGIAVWGFTHKTYVQKIFLLQMKIARIMTFASKTDHTYPIFANLEFLKIDGIRQLQLLSFVYDCHNKLAPVHFEEYFVPCSHVLNSTPGWHPVVIFSSKEKIHFSMEFGPLSLLVQDWNMLPVPLREPSSAAIFRAELKIYLSSSCASLEQCWLLGSVLHSLLL